MTGSGTSGTFPMYAASPAMLGVIAALLFFSCSSSPRFTYDRLAEPKGTSSKAPGKNISGKPSTAEGLASYYAHDFHGKKTANGETFDMHKLTAAHRSYPFDTKVKVTNLDNGKSVVVRINDRGPFKLERIMDLSLGAAEALDMVKSGTARIRLEVVEWGPDEISN